MDNIDSVGEGTDPNYGRRAYDTRLLKLSEDLYQLKEDWARHDERFLYLAGAVEKLVARMDLLLGEVGSFRIFVESEKRSRKFWESLFFVAVGSIFSLLVALIMFRLGAK